MQAVEQDVRQFIIDNFLFGEGGNKLSNTQSFLETGIIDSTGVLELVAFLEEKFGIKIDDSELVPDNLDSISSIVKFVGAKKAA